MLRILLITACLFGLTSAGLALAQDNPTPEKVPNIFYCPPIKALTKDPMTMSWKAKGGFRSNESSFVVKVARFLGAQWVGAEVGQLTCLYHGVEQTSFPILLVFHTLTYEPKSGKWEQNKGGYVNCVSSNQKDCPFSMRLKPKQGNIYQELERMKNNPVPNIPGF